MNGDHDYPRLWINYGLCPKCQRRNRPRVGSITCKGCGTGFSVEDIRIKPPNGPGGWLIVVAGAALMVLVLYGVSRAIGM